MGDMTMAAMAVGHGSGKFWDMKANRNYWRAPCPCAVFWEVRGQGTTLGEAIRSFTMPFPGTPRV